MARRLFHAIVLVGTSLGTGCGSSDKTEPPITTDTGTVADTKANDTFPTIAFDSGSPMDTTVSDTGTTDTFPTIAADTSSDTFPGIMPMMSDTFPGIMPPPPPDGFPPIA